MTPILYDKDETLFQSGGLGFLRDCTSCIVTEERNGVYECEFTYPVDGPLFHEIQEGRIIFADHDESKEGQPFVIYSRSEPIGELVTFYANHISYRLSNQIIMPFTATTPAQAMSGFRRFIVNDSEFTFTTDKNGNGTFEIPFPKSVRDALGGEEGSVLDVFGGEYEFDKFNVILHDRRGEDTNVEIRHGKNLVDFTHTTDTTESYNAVVPYWFKEADDNDPEVLVTLPEYYIAHGSPTRLVMVPLDLSDAFDDKPTIRQLRREAEKQLNDSKAWEISEGYDIDFVALWQTDEYREFAPLQRVKLCDTVLVYFHEYGIEAVREKVVKTVYNTIADRFDEITLNELPETFSGVIS